MGSATPWLAYPASQHFTVSQVAAFVHAADAESFTEAALRLGISQPTLSRNIRDFEQALQVVLFDRSRKGVELSQAGLRLLPAARDLLLHYAQAREGIASWRSCRLAQFRAVGSTAVVPLILPFLLRQLKAEFGTASLSMEGASSDEVHRQVIDGRASLGISGSRMEEPELRYSVVLRAPLGLLVPLGCPVPETICSLDDLASVPMIRLKDQSAVSSLLEGMRDTFKAYFEATVCVPCVTSAFTLAQTSGLAMVASGVAASHPQAAGLRFIPLPDLLPMVDVHVISRRDAPFDERHERMREILCQSLLDTEWHSSVIRVGMPLSTWKDLPTPDCGPRAFA